jgi:hypoxanthine phosphoribosyltransferase
MSSGDSPPPVLLSADRIRQRVGEMAAALRRDCPDDLHLVAVLKGAFVFLADLMRQIPGQLTLDFIALSSYGAATSSSGEVRLLKDLDSTIAGRHVVIVEDVVDTATTLLYLQEILKARSPASLRTACLLDKPSRRESSLAIDYVGFTIPDRFVVGYGLDYAERYRNLPYVGVLASSGPL